MTITTLNGVKLGLQPPVPIVKTIFNTYVVPTSGTIFTSWIRAGNPLAGAEDTTLNGVSLASPITGELPRVNPNAGNAYLARLQRNTWPGAGGLSDALVVLCDRLWHNGGFDITSTSAQNITSPTWPARDENGATAGRGVLLGLEISATVGAGTPTITVAYTDSDAAAQSSTNIITSVAASTNGGFYQIGLAAGSRGVKSVESLTLSSSWTSGTINLVAYRPLAIMTRGAAQAGMSAALDAISGGLVRIYDGSVLFLMALSSLGQGNNAQSGITPFCGKIEYTWG